jgi:hypothetical protein
MWLINRAGDRLPPAQEAAEDDGPQRCSSLHGIPRS